MGRRPGTGRLSDRELLRRERGLGPRIELVRRAPTQSARSVSVLRLGWRAHAGEYRRKLNSVRRRRKSAAAFSQTSRERGISTNVCRAGAAASNPWRSADAGTRRGALSQVGERNRERGGG